MVIMDSKNHVCFNKKKNKNHVWLTKCNLAIYIFASFNRRFKLGKKKKELNTKTTKTKDKLRESRERPITTLLASVDCVTSSLTATSFLCG